MAIMAGSNSTPRELIEAGMHVARCYKIIQIGTVTENFKGENKLMQKVRIGWEFPTLLKVFDEAKGPQPLVFDKEYTLSLKDKANLRIMLTSWRGKAFTEDEAKAFDITKLIGAPCLLNLTHKPSKADVTKIYEEISSVSPLMKGTVCPPQISKSFVLSYDEFNETLFETLPDFIKDKMKGSAEYKAFKNKANNTFVDAGGQLVAAGEIDLMDESDDLPF